MDLHQAKQLTLELMTKHNLNDWSFRFINTRRILGRCDHSEKCIELSSIYCLNHEYNLIRDTILHEIAHALTRGHGHDSVWKRKCIEIGALPNRCKSIDGEKMAKYKLICPNGHITYQNRKTKELGSCSKCSPVYNEKYLFKYV